MNLMSTKNKPLYNHVCIAIMTGGKSTRFGSPKAEAKLGGETLLDIAIRLARQISPHLLLVTNLQQTFEQYNLPRVIDLLPERGPLGGVYTALKYSDQPVVAMLPCDMPLLNTDVYRLLLDRFAAPQPVTGRSEKGLEPLLSVWHTSNAAVIEQLLQQKKQSMREALTALGAREIDFTEELNPYRSELFWNINYRDDLEKLRSKTAETISAAG